jgi:hypothetical protein
MPNAWDDLAAKLGEYVAKQPLDFVFNFYTERHPDLALYLTDLQAGRDGWLTSDDMPRKGWNLRGGTIAFESGGFRTANVRIATALALEPATTGIIPGDWWAKVESPAPEVRQTKKWGRKG